MRIFVISFFTVICLNSCSNKEASKEEKQTKTTPIEETQPSTTPKEEILSWPTGENAVNFLKKYGEENKETVILLQTRLGDIKIKLFEDTPLHRANFLFNVKRELYEKTIFYRVVPNFMIQGGNSDYDKTLEMREENAAFYIPNESKAGHIHKRGAVAMAMTYDDNPQQKSAQYSYYIVIGKKFDDAVLDATEKEYSIKLSDHQRNAYKKVGGTPHLDGVHTVFGEVIEGMEVVEAISNEKTDTGDWPVNDVIIDYKVIE